jgi:phage shock protein PspC (stress-responsive transcriptional regulator)
MVERAIAAHHDGMETTNEQPWAAPGNERPRRVSRQVNGRMLGGVAGGTAAYLGVDPVIVRIGIVALTLFGGLGVVLYAIGWLLIPEDGSEESLAQHALSGRESGQHRWIAIVVGVVAVIAVFGLFSNGPRGWGRGWGTGWSFGFGLFWVVLAAVLVLALSRVKGVHRVWKVLGLMILALIAIVVVTIGGAFAAVAISGVPLHGGVGDREWRPTVPGQLQHDYRLAMGNMTVDLRNVTFPAGSTSITASVGMGHLLVEVPPGVSVSLNAHSGLGAVVYGDGQGNTDAASFGNGSSTSSGNPPAAHLNLTATTGVGVVQLDRGQGVMP